MNTSVYNYEDNGAKKGKIFTKCVGQSKKTFLLHSRILGHYSKNDSVCSVYEVANHYILNHLLNDAPSWFLLTGNH